MNLKEFLVIRNHDDNMEVWARAEYEKYIHETLFVGACPAVAIVTHFNEDERLLAGEELKEGGGMKTKEEILERLQKENPHSIPVFKAMDEYAAQFAGTREEWISVEPSNPLPGYDEPVLWYTESGNQFVAALDKDEWYMDFVKRYSVTHWRKLPNPPNTNILKPI